MGRLRLQSSIKAIEEEPEGCEAATSSSKAVHTLLSRLRLFEFVTLDFEFSAYIRINSHRTPIPWVILTREY